MDWRFWWAVLYALRVDGRQYCIVGAGPGGLQLGHFMKHAGRDYVIFEKAERPGYFFEVFPRHRELISLNKRFVRSNRGADFAFRHDWNSLIDVREEGERTPPVTTRTKAMWPHADVLAGYLREFAEEQKENIEYSTVVSKIRRSSAEHGEERSAGFVVHTENSDSNGTIIQNTHHCISVIVATGFWTPRDAKSTVDGDAHLEKYENMPATGEAYDGHTIAVLGLGNAAMETAKAFQPHAADVTVYGRYRDLPEGGKGVRFAWQTHYVGDIRAGRTNILDNYFLKSLDGLEFETLQYSRLGVIPCLSNQRCLFSLNKEDCLDKRCRRGHDKGGQDLNYQVFMFYWREGTAADKYVLRALEKYARKKNNSQNLDWNEKYEGITLDHAPAADKLKCDHGSEKGVMKEELEFKEEFCGGVNRSKVDMGVYEWQARHLFVSTSELRKNKPLMDVLAALRSRFGDSNNRYPVQHVIRCFGWVMDRSIFDSSIELKTTHKGKYPDLTPMYEAKGVPGLYFAGTLVHGLDFRKSSGGFIHGFRYTSRALFRSLEEQNFGIEWPSTTIRMGEGVDSVRAIATQLLDRINDASGPYQMFESIGDGIVFSKESSGHWVAKYFFEMPLKEFHARYLDSPRLWWVFRYREDFYGPMVIGEKRIGSLEATTAFNSTFFHPKLSFSPAGLEASQATMNHFLSEDVFTMFENQGHTVPFKRWVAKVVAGVTGQSFEDEVAQTAIDENEEDVDAVLQRLVSESELISEDEKCDPTVSGGTCSSQRATA